MTIDTITRGATLVSRFLAFLLSRLTAFAAGCIFVACAAAVLFKDIALNGAPITLDHMLTAGVLSGTLLVGKLLSMAWKGQHPFAVAGFLVLFAVGTVLIVYQSSGKQAEDTFRSQANADFAESERARIAPLLEKAQAMLDGTAKKITDDCVNGRGSKGHCDGLRASHEVYTAAVAGHNAALEKLGPPRTVAPEAENFANLAEVFGADKDMVKAGAVLVVPFIRTMLFELGALWCFGFAFRPLPRSATRETMRGCRVGNRSANNGQPRQPLPAETAQTSFYADDIAATQAIVIGNDREPGNPGNGGKRIFSRAEAMLDITRRVASGETIPSQKTLAEAWGVNPGTASKWLTSGREDGIVPVAQRIGRCNVIRPMLAAD